MKKDAYYFPHFSNARNDAKVIKLRRVLGLEGYGIYFMLLEILREQTDFKYPIMGIEDLAYEWHVSKEKIASVINDFGLFEIVEDIFFSPKFILYLQPYIEKTERARAAANKRWAAVKSDANAYANALPQQCEVDANGMQGKESKREESKVKESKEVKADVPPPVVIVPKYPFSFKSEYSFFKDEFEEIFTTEFIPIKKKKKAALTERALKTQLNKIQGFSKGNYSIALEILNNSVNSGWSDFYQLKTNGTPKAKTHTINPDIQNDPDRMKW